MCAVNSKVLFYGNVREYTNEEKSFAFTGACSTVRELIDTLGAHYGARFREYALGEETCFFLVNGKGLMMTGGLDTRLNAGDTIEVLPFAQAG